MYWFWLGKAGSEMTGQKDSTKSSLLLSFILLGGSQYEVGKMVTKRWAQSHMPEASKAGRTEGFSLLQVIYAHICPYINPPKSFWSHMGPMTTLVCMV